MTSGIATPFGGEYASTQTTDPEVEATRDVVSDHQAVIAEWGIPAGEIMVVRDQIERQERSDGEGHVILSKVKGPDGREVAILGDDQRGEWMQTFHPWATVLMVGEAYATDYGHTIQPPPVKPGMRVLIAATAASDIDLEAGGETMRVTLVPFRAIKLWRKDEK